MTNIPSTNADISCVPPEILSEIFVCCLQAEDSASRNIQPLLLGSVCRLWHTLALATPALWASLDITYDLEGDILRPPLPVIQTYLQRSGTHPLSIVLGTADLYHDSPLPTAVLTALTATRQRWDNVHIELAKMTQEILDFVTKGDAPLLQSIRCEVFGTPQGLPIPLRMLHGCPRLKTFQWRSLGLPFLPPLGDTQLTSLSLRTTLSVSECITILHLSPHLSSAEFDDLDSPGPSTAPHLTHPTLRTLIITGVHFATLLAALTLPALLDLDITDKHTPNLLPTGWDNTLAIFFERSKPMLERLSLFANQMPLEPTLLRILTLTPHLHTLELIGYFSFATPLTPALIHALHPTPPPGTPLCPRLQILELSWISGCSDGLCGAMLRARWGDQAHTNGVACLEWASIGLKGGPHHRDQADMMALRAGGMQGTIDST